MLINFSNHPLVTWSKEQIEATTEFGEIIDIPFPAVKPEASHEEVKELADVYVDHILSLKKDEQIIVHIMGEMTFVYRVVSLLKEQGVTCIASTTERDAEMTTDGRKISDFQFVKFRRY